MPLTPDRYETDSGTLIGHTLADCVEWARNNPEAFAKTNVWWTRDDDCEAIMVDRDIRDELAFETGEWFGPGDDIKSLQSHSTSTAHGEQAA